jgi:hypothetical protein
VVRQLLQRPSVLLGHFLELLNDLRVLVGRVDLGLGILDLFALLHLLGFLPELRGSDGPSLVSFQPFLLVDLVRQLLEEAIAFQVRFRLGHDVAAGIAVGVVVVCGIVGEGRRDVLVAGVVFLVDVVQIGHQAAQLHLLLVVVHGVKHESLDLLLRERLLAACSGSARVCRGTVRLRRLAGACKTACRGSLRRSSLQRLRRALYLRRTNERVSQHVTAQWRAREAPAPAALERGPRATLRASLAALLADTCGLTPTHPRDGP